MFSQKIKFLLLILTVGIISGCANIKTEPADDGYDSNHRNGGEGWSNGPPDLSQRWLNKQIDQALGNSNSPSKEQSEVEARLERLENQQNGIVTAPSGDITSPPGSGGYRPASNSKSYQEWKQAREGGSQEYKEFQEYKQWLEFQKNKAK
jgi:hypothetical protein